MLTDPAKQILSHNISDFAQIFTNNFLCWYQQTKVFENQL